MRASSGMYPSLGRYFKTSQEMADAGCMSRVRLRDCLDGKKEFTKQEKSAICCRALYKCQIHFEGSRQSGEGNERRL